MGLGTAALWFVDAPDPIAVLRSGVQSDTDAAAAVARKLHPGLEPTLVGMAPLTAFAVASEPNRVLVGCYPGITVVCASEPAAVRPSTLEESWTSLLPSTHTFLVASEREHAWGAFAQWDSGTLKRSFSAGPTYIHEDEGLPFPWERPFWSGDHPLQFDGEKFPDPQALPFHPQEFADAASAQWLGVRMIGGARDGDTDPGSVLLCDFAMRDPAATPPPEPPRPETPEPQRKRGLFRRR
ncbi:hypothetical protein HQ305_10955 [Rhodococcus sp. BP-149]|uniref:DUF6928 family protein n=1 Tax=unclassified Rhodococcus (in: high G+C Gram-positive bacteria) TaxID=192944 RepID=UPI001C9B2F0A|nr:MULTISPECIES: hypothetical protein [unclassified Rhodococcus (in: high G+C Gram-positive bacteria)]MBY6685300.1 hypothetical protein [Rhodococcus sp. BP-288]MBY6695936.1 hypothetical protein [Rhodococcus sp. BP-188]MBY6696998.1 hypothetical protein [Rhodococcus sp. BP-285]MBY6703654.1 hypothetical protein [Rhodococcus sp. BP-283]MBY6710392.1 hypothetical protein [Rhodococcus sp. BP-160]